MPLCRASVQSCKTIQIPPKLGNAGGGLVGESCTWKCPPPPKATAGESPGQVLLGDGFSRAEAAFIEATVRAAPGEIVVVTRRSPQPHKACGCRPKPLPPGFPWT